MFFLKREFNTQGDRWTFANFFATLNVVLIVVGFASVASLFTPFNLIYSQSLTIPYRVFALVISLITIVFGILKKQKLPEMSFAVWLFYAIYAILIIKIVYSQVVFAGSTHETPLRVFGIISYCLFASISMLFSYRLIRYDYASLFIVLLSFYVLALRPLGFLNTIDDLLLDTANMRAGNSDVLNPISLGYVACVAVVISVYNILSNRFGIIYKALSVALIPLAMYSLIKSGSRSPILVCALVLLIYLSSYVKNYIFALFSMGISLVICYFARFSLIGILEIFSPFTAKRFEQMLLEQHYSGREELAEMGLQEATSHPLIGSSIEALCSSPLCGYHSAVIDAFAYLGFIGGSITILLYVYIAMVAFKLFINKANAVFSWVPLVALVYIFYGLLAGRLFHSVEISSSFMVLTLLMNNELKQNFKIQRR